MGPRWPSLAACIGLAACSFKVDPGPGRFRCDQGDRCPDGTSCIDGWCEAFDAGDQPLPSCQAGANVRVSSESGRSAQTDITWTGQEFGVVWTQATSPPKVLFNLLDPNGSPNGMPIPISDPAVSSTWPTIAWTGEVFAAFFASDGFGPAQLTYRAISPDGVPPADNPIPLAPSVSGAVPSRAEELGDGELGVAWQNQVEGNDEVYFNRYTAGGAAAGGDILVTENLGASWFPAIVWTGQEWGVAWNDDRDGNIEIYFTRLDADGDRLEGDRRLTNAPGPSFAPALVWTGDAYLVSWWDGRADPAEVFTARVTPGEVSQIAPELRLTPGEYGQVALMARSGEWIGITWHGNGDDLFAPVFALLDPGTGALLTAPLPLSEATVDIDPESLAMTAASDGFGVVWADDRSGDVEIYFTRVTCE